MEKWLKSVRHYLEKKGLRSNIQFSICTQTILVLINCKIAVSWLEIKLIKNLFLDNAHWT